MIAPASMKSVVSSPQRSWISIISTVAFFGLSSAQFGRERELSYEQLPKGITILPERPNYSLAKPRSSVLTQSGELFLIEGADATILRFGAQGEFVSRLGGRGGGPGEFKDPGSVRVRGDSIVVWDPALSRISIFTLTGRLLRTIPIRAPGVGILLWDGRVATLTERSFGLTSVGSEQLTQLIIRDLNGMPLDTLLSESTPYTTLRVRHASGGYVVAMQPLEDSPLVSVSDDGARSLKVTRKGSRRGTFTVTIRDLRNGGEISRQFSDAAIRVDQAIASLAVHSLARPGLDKDEIERALYVPEFLPLVTLAFFLPDNSIVLRGSESFGGPYHYRVLAPDGRARLSISLPQNVRIVSGYGSRLVFLERDTLGLPTYRVVDVSKAQ